MKKITFYENFEKQRNDALSYSQNLTYLERLEEGLRLTKKAFGKFFSGEGSKEIKKIITIHKGIKGEKVEDFYKRIRY